MTTGWEKGWKKSVSRLPLYAYKRNPHIPKVAALYDTPRTLAMNLVTRATTIDPGIFVTFCTVLYMNMGGISWMYCLNTWKPALIKNPSSASTEYICIYNIYIYMHHITFSVNYLSPVAIRLLVETLMTFTFRMMTSSNGNIFFFTGPLCREFTGHGGIPLTKASDAELWYFHWSVPELTAVQTIETPVIWDTIVPIIKSL